MTAVAGVSHLSGGSGRHFRKAKSTIATVTIVGAFLIALVPLALIIGYVIYRGAAVIDWDFLTGEIAYSPRSPSGGIGPAIVGTLVITGAATLMAVPLGVLGGIWINEYGGGSRLASFVRFLADVMTGVPSIVMGLFIYTFIVLNTHETNGFAGSLALACLMLPVVIRTTEEMLRLVPGDQREASTALGSRKARTIMRVVLPAALPGIVSGALLAVARAAGETAPLLFTIGFTFTTNTKLLSGGNTALSVQIFGNANTAFEAAQDRAWGAALTLIVLVFLFTIAARIISALFVRKQG
jgi:phosphate transport system permease protein